MVVCMAEVLSQKQIDELLGNLQSGGGALDQKIEEEQSSKQYKAYDFINPKRITREQIKILDSIFENFARLFALQISSLIRTNCEAEVIQLEEQQYYEFSNALTDSMLVGSFHMQREEEESDEQLILQMGKPLSYCLMDRLLGGSGAGYDIDKDYTDIEIAIMEFLFQKTATVFTNAWSNYIDLQCAYNMIETNARLMQSIDPDETVIIIIIELTVRNLKENINICLPSDTLNTIFRSFETKFARSTRKVDSEIEQKRQEYLMDSLSETPLTVSGVLGETEIRLQDLLNLQVGDVLTLDTPTQGDTVKVKVDGRTWFNGVMGVKKNKYAVRVGKVLE